MSATLDAWAAWIQELGDQWSGGLTSVTPAKHGGSCSASWRFASQYIFHGDRTEADFVCELERLQDSLPDHQRNVSVATFADWWQFTKEKPISGGAIFPINKDVTNGITSAAVKADMMGNLTEFVKADLLAVRDGSRSTEQHEMFHCPGSASPGSAAANTTSISPGFREAIVHYLTLNIADPASEEGMYSFAENSYFGESSYTHQGDSWKQRYWGSHYEELLSVKKKYDPERLFWCHHCVGAELQRSVGRSDQAMVV